MNLINRSGLAQRLRQATIVRCQPRHSSPHAVGTVRLLWTIRPPQLPDAHEIRDRELTHRHKFKHDRKKADPEAIAALDRGDEPLSVFDNANGRGSANVATAQSCLEAYWKSLDGLAEEDAARTAQQLKGGERILQWLLSAAPSDVKDFVASPGFIYALVHVLLAEGSEDVVWQWLQVEDGLFDNSQLYTDNPKLVFVWRGFLFRDLVSAQLDRCRPHRNADHAIRSVLKALKLKRTGAGEGFRQMALRPTYFLLRHVLGTGQWDRTDVTLWDHFANLSRAYWKNGASIGRPMHSEHLGDANYAQLMLARPGGPRVEAALKLLKPLMDDAPKSSLLPENEQEVRYLTAFMRGTLAALQQTNDNKASEWVRTVLERHQRGELLRISRARARTSGAPGASAIEVVRKVYSQNR